MKNCRPFNFFRYILVASLLLPSASLTGLCLPSSADEAVATSSAQPDSARFPIAHPLSLTGLEKKPTIKISVNEGGKTVEYQGVALRALLAEIIPEIETMKQWKSLARRKLLVEISAADGFAALISVTEIATNIKGDRFVLALKQDGKPVESLKLICPNDEHHVRWVKNPDKIQYLQIKE